MRHRKILFHHIGMQVGSELCSPSIQDPGPYPTADCLSLSPTCTLSVTTWGSECQMGEGTGIMGADLHPADSGL